MKTGWIKEPRSFKDYSTEKLFGAAKVDCEIFEHDITGVPLVFQGSENTCVSCSVSFIQQWIERNHPDLSHEWLAEISDTTPEGAKPSKVLDAAKKIGICTESVWDLQRDMAYLDAGQHQIAAYAYSETLERNHLALLIKKCPIMVGVDDYKGMGPHMMAAIGFNLVDNVVKCANWHRADKQDIQLIPFHEITFAANILTEKPIKKPTMRILSVLKSKLAALSTRGKYVLFGASLLTVLGITLAATSGDQLFGAGYAPVTGYSSRTTSYISSVATTIPVASTKDKAGNQITLSNVSPSSTVRVYMNIEPGTSREEPVACTGVTTASWTNCLRGLSFQGSDLTASSTLAKAHNAGASIIITNTGQFYGEYLTVEGAQNVYGVKTYYSFPEVAGATALPSANGQFATKYYVDTVGAGGFTSVNVSTTRGLSVDSSSPEKVGINLMSGYGLRFLSSGDLVISTTTALTWSGAQTFASLAGTSTVDTFKLTGYASNKESSMNKQSTDLAVLQGSATGTAKTPITAGRALWVSATSTLAHTSTAAASSTFQFVGIALNSAATGAEVHYARPGETTCGMTGLVPGMAYYLNGASGQVATTGTTYFAKIGRAVSTKCLQLMTPHYKNSGSQNMDAATGSYVQTVGFYPAKLEVYTLGTTLASFNGSERNSSITLASPPAIQSYAYSCTAGTHGTITNLTATGFTFSHTKASSDACTAYWIAESL